MIFPDPRQKQGDLILIGGSVNAQNVMAAYHKGIFPWYSDGEPVMWWSLNPRFVLFPSRPHISRSLIRQIKRRNYELSIDKAFGEVLENCRNIPRPGQDGTWITEEIFAAYFELHCQGHAHSVEVWLGTELIGGLYGVSFGGCFYGESMFTKRSNSSKIAFTALIGLLDDNNFGLIDCQVQTRHLSSFGAIDMPRENFMRLLDKELLKPGLTGNWGKLFPSFPQSSLWSKIMNRCPC